MFNLNLLVVLFAILKNISAAIPSNTNVIINRYTDKDCAILSTDLPQINFNSNSTCLKIPATTTAKSVLPTDFGTNGLVFNYSAADDCPKDTTTKSESLLCDGTCISNINIAPFVTCFNSTLNTTANFSLTFYSSADCSGPAVFSGTNFSFNNPCWDLQTASFLPLSWNALTETLYYRSWEGSKTCNSAKSAESNFVCNNKCNSFPLLQTMSYICTSSSYIVMSLTTILALLTILLL